MKVEWKKSIIFSAIISQMWQLQLSQLDIKPDGPKILLDFRPGL